MTPPPLRPLSVLAIRHGRGGGAAVPRLGARIVAVAVVALGVGALAGCTTEPEPAPTPTAAFANEEEAFAAAEKVYRAYFDALSARRLGNFEPDPQDFLSSSALEGDIDAQRSLGESGLRANGEAKILSFSRNGASFNQPSATIALIACIDVSEVHVVDVNGVDVTPPDRGNVIAQLVEFTGDHDRLLIAYEDSADNATC